MGQRVFIAINLPPAVKNELEQLIFILQKENSAAQINWVKKQNLHLTLHFLGSQDDSVLADIGGLLLKVTLGCPKISLGLNGQGAFPSIDRPKVIYASLTEIGSNHLKNLRESLGRELVNLNFKIDQRSWQPHVTLGRVKTPTKIKLPTAELAEEKFIISSVDLMKSDLRPTGPSYTILEEYKLK